MGMERVTEGLGRQTVRLRELLDERGIKYNVLGQDEFGKVVYFDLPDGREVGFTDFYDGHTQLRIWDCTPTQAIAATVGNRTDLSKRLREVNGLHEFAELFGFSWADESDWTWHDVARAMADAVDAAMVGAGTCVDEDSDPNDFKCSVCGARSYIQANDTYTTVLDDHVTILKKFNYCPNCGARVVSE